MTNQTQHILATLEEATPAEIVAGKNWYEDAYDLAYHLGRLHPAGLLPVGVEMAAGVIAALSPRMPWGRNKELAVRAFADGHASGTLGNSVRAANRILGGDDPLEVLKGDKVRNFYLSILGGTDSVTVDRHALEVYLGKRFKDAERPAVGKRLYREVSAAYVQAAHIQVATTFPLTPVQVQAITWLVWRRKHLVGTRSAHVLEG